MSLDSIPSSQLFGQQQIMGEGSSIALSNPQGEEDGSFTIVKSGSIQSDASEVQVDRSNSLAATGSKVSKNKKKN